MMPVSRTVLYFLAISSVALACSDSQQTPQQECVGAKCDDTSDTGSDTANLQCYDSAKTGARRCAGEGLEGLARLVNSGFQPIAPMSCEDVSAGDPNDPAHTDAVFEQVIPVCEALPHCLFKQSSGSCIEAWPLVDQGIPSVQCDLIDSADISAEAKRAYCDLEVCAGGTCDKPCSAVENAATGDVRCLAAGPAALAAAIDAGEKPLLEKTCREVDAIAAQLEPELGHDEAAFLMASICDSMPHCLFKESGEFCMPAWEIVDTASPDVQCRLIDGAGVTEKAKEGLCGLPVETGCGGNDCNRCEWQPAIMDGFPGTCRDTMAGL